MSFFRYVEYLPSATIAMCLLCILTCCSIGLVLLTVLWVAGLVLITIPACMPAIIIAGPFIIYHQQEQLVEMMNRATGWQFLSYVSEETVATNK